MAPPILLRNGTVLKHSLDDRITALKQTDVLVQGNEIHAIGANLTSPDGTQIIDCTHKIISPGFVNTHHHLWQTQMAGRHVDHSLFDYIPTGNLQSYNYSPTDTFWGQLTGALAAIDGGTTYVLDHAHGCYSTDHIHAAVDALVSSGLRSTFAYAEPTYLDKWNQDDIVPSQKALPEADLNLIEELAKGQPIANGLVTIGLGFDKWFLPKDLVIDLFSRFQKAGVTIFTSHICRNVVLSTDLALIESYGLLDSLPNFVLSHCTGMTDEDLSILKKHKTPISSTPETEAPMAMGWPVLFEPGLNVSIGVDCHSSNPFYMPQVARTGLILARTKSSLDVGAPNIAFPETVRGSTEEVFNALTIQGARAVGLESQIGSIEIGKKADLVVFSTSTPILRAAAENDPLAAVVRFTDTRDVDIVLVDGKVRKKAGKLVSVEVPARHLGQKDVDEELSMDEVIAKLLESQKELDEKIQGVSIGKCREMLTHMLHIEPTKFRKLH